MRLAIILVAAIITGVLIATTTYHAWYVVEEREVPIRFNITNESAGVLVEDRFLAFGNIPEGGGASKTLTIRDERAGRYSIAITGSAAPFVSAEPASETIPADVEFLVTTPPEGALGSYEGVARITLFRR